MYFCDDVDLMVWEPGIFGEAAFGHQCLVKGEAGTIAGTDLTMSAGVLGPVLPAMVASVDAGGGVVQLLEVTAVADATHATVSSLRGRASEAAIPGWTSGSVSVTVVSFRPQIAAVGDALLELVGLANARDEAGVTVEHAKGFRTACVLGVLAAVFRVLAATAAAAETVSEGIVAGTGAANAVAAKRDFYDRMYAEARRVVRAKVEGQDRRAAVGELVRT